MPILSKLVRVCGKTLHGPKVRRLYNGDMTGCSSRSEAADKFCNLLAPYFDKDEIDYIVRDSDLFCEELKELWDKEYNSDGQTHGQKIIETAIAACPKKYQQATSSIKGITADALMKKKFPEQKWAVRNILPAGLSILGGKPKMGKSIFALNTGIAVSLGEIVFGKIPTEKGTVICFALEDTLRRLQERLKTMLQGRQAPKELSLYTQVPRMGSGGLSFLEDEIKKFDDVRLVIIDTLGKFRPPIKSQQNSYGVDYEHISKIKEIADSYDISVLLIHHLRKTGAADVMDTFSGTLGLTGAADGLLVLVRLTNQVGAELHITGRDVGAAEYALRFEQKTLSWSLIGAADEVRSTAQQQKLYDALKKYAQEDPVTPTDLKDFTGLKIEYIKKILPKMLKGGSVRRIGHGKYIFIGNHDY